MAKLLGYAGGASLWIRDSADDDPHKLGRGLLPLSSRLVPRWL